MNRSIKKIPTWFWTTSDGKNLSSLIVGFVGIGAGAISFLKQSIYSQNYVDLIHLYKSGFKVEVSEEVKTLFEKCLEMLKIDEELRPFALPYTVLNFDFKSFGSLKYRYGAHIGLPENLYYQSQLDINKEEMQINLKPVDWISPAGESFAESLILSEGAKTYAICREILMAKDNKSSIESCFLPLSIIGAYGTAKRINTKLNLYYRPLSIRGTMYCLTGTFFLGLYFLMKDSFNWYCENKADEQLADMGPEMTKNGIDFYSQLLKRNIALRKLRGDNGSSHYSAKGDEVYFIRVKHVPISQRKKFLQDKLKEYESSANIEE